MKSLMAMLNNDLPSIYSKKDEPFPPGNHRQSYILFDKLCKEADFPLYFASPYDYNWENGLISGWWEPRGDNFIPHEEAFEPCFIFDKSTGADPQCSAVIEQYEASGVPIFDPPSLARFCDDKWRSYQQFSKYIPLTALLKQDRATLVDQILAFFDEMDRRYEQHDNLVVVKPLHGFQSRGVHRISRNNEGLGMHMLFGGNIQSVDIERHLDTMATVPYLIQAWVNTTQGIPGIGLENEFHDVRFIFRIRKPGLAEFILLYIKTLHGMEYVSLEQLEETNPFDVVCPIAEWISNHFPYGIFCVDVMRDISGTWFLTELNDQVGLTINFSNDRDVQEMTRFMRIFIEEMKYLQQA